MEGNGDANAFEDIRRTQRYREIEREADVFGRIIGVRRLKLSEQTRITGLCPELSGHDILDVPIYDANGEDTGNTRRSYVSHRGPLMLAASVCELNRHPLPFPRTRVELDTTYDLLDGEGLEAAGNALKRLIDRTEFAPEQTKEMAKNLSGTSSSDSNNGLSETVSP
jgi:hypothetical protein